MKAIAIDPIICTVVDKKHVYRKKQQIHAIIDSCE